MTSVLKTASLTVVNNVTEFSVDATLGGTGSANTKLPTQKAVKSYVDAQIATVQPYIMSFQPSLCDTVYTGLTNGKVGSMCMQFYVPTSVAISKCTILQETTTTTSSMSFFAIITSPSLPYNYYTNEATMPWGTSVVCQSASLATSAAATNSYVDITLPTTTLSPGVYTVWICGFSSGGEAVKIMGHDIGSGPSIYLQMKEAKGTYTSANWQTYTPYAGGSNYTFSNPTNMPWFLLH